MDEFDPYTNIVPISPYPCKKWMPTEVDFNTGEVEYNLIAWTEEDEMKYQNSLNNISVTFEFSEEK